MKPKLNEVLGDLATEGDLLDAMVAPLDDAGWHLATPAEGWDIAHQVAHLAWTDEVAVIAATDADGWHALVEKAAGDPYGFVDASATEGAAADPGELLDRWRSVRAALTEALANHPAGEKIPWFGPPMSATSMATARFMETWAHSLDVAETLGRPPVPSDRVRHVVHLGVRTRDFAFVTNGLEVPSEEFRVELVAPSGERWTYGPDAATQTVRGSAYDFCLLVTQRRHRADLDLTATGTDAEQWLVIAQAFAGPSGEGRAPERTG